MKKNVSRAAVYLFLAAIILPFQNCGKSGDGLNIQGSTCVANPNLAPVPKLTTYTWSASNIKRSTTSTAFGGQSSTAASDVGYLAAPGAAATQPLYECLNSAIANDYFLTLRADCEGAGPGQVIGQVYSTQVPGSVKLTRCWAQTYHYATASGSCGADTAEVDILGFVMTASSQPSGQPVNCN